MSRAHPSAAAVAAARQTLRWYRDDGPLAAAVVAALRGGAATDRSATSRAPGRLEWLLPPLLRLVEYGLVLVLAARSDTAALPLFYGLLAVLAFHHYDVVYRLRVGGPRPPRWLGWLGAGWDGRGLVLLAAAAGDRLPVVVPALALWCAALFVGESVTSWLRLARRQHAVAGRAEA